MPKQNPDPFYEWLDHEGIRDLVHRAHELEGGERLILIKGLVPSLVEDLGIAGFEEFLSEIQTKARRYEEARTHPGETNEEKHTPGETLGGPTPEGHVHLEGHRDSDRPGGRAVERAWEAEAWEGRGEGDRGS